MNKVHYFSEKPLTIEQVFASLPPKYKVMWRDKYFRVYAATRTQSEREPGDKVIRIYTEVLIDKHKEVRRGDYE